VGTYVSELDNELRRLATELVGALHDEPTPSAILDLAARLQAALNRRLIDMQVPAGPE